MRATPTILLVALLAAGCVPKKRHEESLAEGERLRVEVEALTTRVSELEGDRTRLERELEASEAALEVTNRKLAEKIAEAGELKDDVEAMELALQAAELRKARADAALREYEQLVARFQGMIDAGTLEVKVIDGKMVVEMATDILFGAGSATLSTAGRASLEDVARVLASIPGRDYQVAGHTDSMPIATERFPSNWHLGAERAISVVQVLAEAGLSPDRISAASFAEYEPVDTNRTAEGRASNRRIEIIVVPDLSQLPGYQELEAITDGEGASPR